METEEKSYHPALLSSISNARGVLARPSKFFLANRIRLHSRVYKLVAEHSHQLCKARCECSILTYSVLSLSVQLTCTGPPPT